MHPRHAALLCCRAADLESMNLTHRRLRTPLIFAMALCMLLAQALVMLHRIAHAPAAVRSVSQPQALAQAVGANTAAHWIQALLPRHDSDRSCDLYDQLTHSDAAPGSSPGAATPSPDESPAAIHRASCLAAQAAGFLARGPPAQG